MSATTPNVGSRSFRMTMSKPTAYFWTAAASGAAALRKPTLRTAEGPASAPSCIVRSPSESPTSKAVPSLMPARWALLYMCTSGSSKPMRAAPSRSRANFILLLRMLRPGAPTAGPAICTSGHIWASAASMTSARPADRICREAPAAARNRRTSAAPSRSRSFPSLMPPLTASQIISCVTRSCSMPRWFAKYHSFMSGIFSSSGMVRSCSMG
mmetsp:Transcript_11377/g.33935  ORF Transcript_11377/g.33935 Transcript_11377/m.33935 type:complete len:212 (+) Transcript_11377:54-689(+)